MAIGYMGAIEKFEESINTAQNPQIAALAEGLKLLAQAVRSDLQKLDRELGVVKSEVHNVRSRVQSLRS